MMGSMNFFGITFLENIHIFDTQLNGLPVIALYLQACDFYSFAGIRVLKTFFWRFFLIVVRKCEGWKFLMNC